MALTDTQIRQLKPGAKLAKHSDSKGLQLWVHPNGSKYWRGAYRFAGKQKSLAIGVYPEVSLKEARDLWSEAREALADGIDPVEAKKFRARTEAEADELTFKVVAMEWHAKQSKSGKWRPATAQENKYRLETDIFPVVGNIPIRKVTRAHMKTALKAIEERGALETCSRARAMCERIFDFAEANEYCDHNPARPMREVLAQPARPGHFAAIEVEELPKLVADIYRNQARMQPKTRIALHIMLRTFVRTKELFAMPWSELDWDKAMWIVPEERMKKQRDHMVPLSRQVLALFRELHALTGHSKLAFPNVRRPTAPMSENAILKVLERMGYAGKMTGHGFRTVAMSTLTQELGWNKEIVHLQLSHVKEDKVDAAYNRAQWISDRTRMMQEWSDYIDQLAKDALSSII